MEPTDTPLWIFVAETQPEPILRFSVDTYPSYSIFLGSQRVIAPSSIPPAMMPYSSLKSIQSRDANFAGDLVTAWTSRPVVQLYFEILRKDSSSEEDLYVPVARSPLSYLLGAQVGIPNPET